MLRNNMKVLAALFLIFVTVGCSNEKKQYDTAAALLNIENAKALDSCLATANDLLDEQEKNLKLMEENNKEMEESNAVLESCANSLADAVESLYECRGIKMPPTLTL